MIDPQAQSILAPVLAEGEAVRWAAVVDRAAYAQAAAGHMLYAGALAIVGAVLVVTAGALLSSNAVSASVALGPGLALAALGVAGIVGAAHRVLMIQRGRGAVYGLTDRRVMVASRSGRLRTWIPLSRVLGVHALGDQDAGTVTLTASPHGAQTARLALALNAIRRPHAVEALLLDLLSSPSAKEHAA